jgi:uncharacterized OB-fold protein
MEFQNFGQKSFVTQTKISGFVDHLRQGRVMANRCVLCQKMWFPPRTNCAVCGSEELEWFEINEIGSLMTFTTVFYGPAGFEQETPYTLGVVSFPCGINVFGQIHSDIPLEEIRIGMALRAVSASLSEKQFSYRFEEA